MNFFEAMQALESGKTVFSHYSHWLYKLIDGGIVGRHSISNNYWDDAFIMPKETKGQWAIYEEESKQPEDERNLLWALKQLKAGKKVKQKDAPIYWKQNQGGRVFFYFLDGSLVGEVSLFSSYLDSKGWEVVE